MTVVCVLAHHPVFLFPEEFSNMSQKSFLKAADYFSSLTDKSLRAEIISKSQFESASQLNSFLKCLYKLNSSDQEN